MQFWGKKKQKPVIGNLCLIRSICFSDFDPEKSSFHRIADNSNEFLSFDGLPNALNRRYRALQNKSTLAEVFPENKALFNKSCIAAYNKQKLSWKQKLKENENGDKSGSCNMNLKIKKRTTKKRAWSSEKLWNSAFSVAKEMSRKIFINVKHWKKKKKREKKINLTHCGDGEIRKGTLVFSFRITASTKLEVSALTNPSPELTITTSLFQMLLLNFCKDYKQSFCKNFVIH